MDVLKAYKFKLEPTTDQIETLLQFVGNRRFVWNKALSMNFWRVENGYRIMGYAELCKLLTLWRSSEEYGFLNLSHVHTLQQALKDQERAFKDWFDKTQPNKKKPQIKKKGKSADSIRYPDPTALGVDDNLVKLPKIGWVKFRRSQRVKGEIRSVTVSLSGGRWHVSILVKQTRPAPVHPSNTACGIDRGIALFAAVTDGENHQQIKPLNSFRKSEKKLARLQRGLSRKIKFSSNWQKQKARINRLHTHIANQRKDFLHKLSHDISKNHAMIFVENLNVSGMSKSAKGSIEQPGKSVKAKSGLNKAILDQGWSEFQRQLAYKSRWSGGDVMAVPAHYTSQECPACGHTHRDNRKTQAEFKCTDCGFAENADVVGAINVLARGHRVIACGAAA